MAFSLEKTRQKLQAEEICLKHWEKRNRICKNTVGIFFVMVAWLGAFLTHFSYAACFGGFPSVILGRKFAADPEDALLLCTMIVFFTLIGGTAILAGVIRLATRKAPATGAVTDQADSLQAALQQAKEMEKRWNKKTEFLAPMILAIIGTMAMVAVSTLLCKNGTATADDISNNTFIGAAYIVVCFVLSLSVKKWVQCPIPAESQATTLANEIARQIKKESEEAEKRQHQVERQEKIAEGVALFLAGDYKEAAKLFKNFSMDSCGDITAIKVLSDRKRGQDIAALRESYDLLWKAKDLGFYNDSIRKAADEALAIITPVVDDAAREDMLTIMKNFLDDHHGSLQLNCKPHIAYGYPDAIVLDIVTRIQSDVLNNPRYYREWLEKMKLAKRRGLSDFAKDISEEIITKLESAIRYNEEIEKEERKRAEKFKSSFTPYYYQTGALPTWAEPSGWTDFRTGETLYRVDGNIVNGKGEIVSPAWWE